MSPETAFVGDVHGNLPALRAIWEVLGDHGRPHAVFLGDYINKGSQSAAVMNALLEFAHAGRATLLAGNHEVALLEALEASDLTDFLKMGGAMTIRSYVGGPVGPDVLGDFSRAFPAEHLDALRRMRDAYETDDLIAQHDPRSGTTSKFRISAHVPVGNEPLIGSDSAQLDTGCGADAGRLTALLWPSLRYVQVDTDGAILLR